MKRRKIARGPSRQNEKPGVHGCGALCARHFVEPLAERRWRITALLGIVDEKQLSQPLFLQLDLENLGLDRRLIVDRLDRVFAARPDRVGHAGLDALLDLGKAVIGIGDRRVGRALHRLELLPFELVGLPERRQALLRRAVRPWPVGRWVEAKDDERATAFALQLAVVNECIVEQDGVLPSFVIDLVPLPPEAPRRFACGRLACFRSCRS